MGKINPAKQVYQALIDHFGPRGWWPGKTPFEVVVGAVLTQNTNWQNVVKAINNLEAKGLLSLGGISSLKEKELAALIRPSGYYNLKAKRLLNLVSMIRGLDPPELASLKKYPLKTAREKLLSVWGIGPETADSILLYAIGKPIFVVDAYTKRILCRHSLCEEDASYAQIQNWFMKSLPNQTKLFNEYHALMVETGKQYCRKTAPLCNKCPLLGFSPLINA